jgi:hypothetical protein
MALMRLAAPLLLAAAIALPAAAECAAPESLAHLSGAQPFVQTRTLKGVARPLRSEGQVEIAGQTAVWRVTSPVAIVTRISPTGITQSVDGGPEERLGAASTSNPFLTETGLLDLLKGDLSQMDARYDVQRGHRNRPEGWTLSLRPKSAQLSPYISTIRIEGCRRVESIAVDQANGDSIRIELTEPAR